LDPRFQRFQSMGDWPHSFWACSEADQHGLTVCLEEAAPHLMPTGKQKEKETGVPKSPLRTHPCDLTPPSQPHLLKVLSPSNSPKLRTIPLTYGPLGDIPDANYSSDCVWEQVISHTEIRNQSYTAAQPLTQYQPLRGQDRSQARHGQRESFFFFFLWDWSLNSGLHACKVHTLLLEPHLLSILLWLFWR
jgi:hypothetical protein